ncbi:MAG: aldo/keto reductase [Candidatus Heimdallarchaeota archaeon]|nr:aldo/keto reductase [Candidatus Heimdallarchaeota archaeon]MCK4878220.1 aldo/keto reductase [Candidatus Heimdallarchaeota archaeon]
MSVDRLQSNGVNLSSLGLGIEHFARGVRKVTNLTREENSKLIINEAYKYGLTHFDLVFNLPYFFDVFREFIKDKREKITFTTHLGSFYNEKANGHSKTRSLNKIKETYEGMLDNLDVDYADIALIQYISHSDDYKKVVENGLLDYAFQLKNEGKAKAVGLSSHKPDLLMKIIEENELDVIMFPLNFATGILDSTKKLIKRCKEKGVAIIAIKNLLKGKAFTTKKTDYPAYFCGGKRFTLNLDEPTTPAQCIKYGLDSGADSVVFGVKTVDEMKQNIQSYQSEKDNADYSQILKVFKQVN